MRFFRQFLVSSSGHGFLFPPQGQSCQSSSDTAPALASTREPLGIECFGSPGKAPSPGRQRTRATPSDNEAQTATAPGTRRRGHSCSAARASAGTPRGGSQRILPRVPQFKPGFTGGILCRVLREALRAADSSGELRTRPVQGALLCSRGQKTVPTPAMSTDTTPLFPGVRNAAPHSGPDASHHAARLTCSIALLPQNSPRWRQPAGAPEPQGRWGGGEGTRGSAPQGCPGKASPAGTGLVPVSPSASSAPLATAGQPRPRRAGAAPGHPCTHTDTCTSGQTTAHTGVLPSAASSSVHNTLTRLERRLKRLCCGNVSRPPDLAANRSRL